MLVKSLIAADHITHLKECFHTMNEYGNKLNPAKCMFRVTSGEFFGYIFTQRGIKGNPKKSQIFSIFQKKKLYLELIITKLQVFARKIKIPHKMCHLIWQLITGYVAVTKNLTHCHMWSDNYIPRCANPDESITHAIFECSSALYAWYLLVTSSSPNIFHVPSVYANIYYFFGKRTVLRIQKALNHKLFKGIQRSFKIDHTRRRSVPRLV